MRGLPYDSSSLGSLVLEMLLVDPCILLMALGADPFVNLNIHGVRATNRCNIGNNIPECNYDGGDVSLFCETVRRRRVGRSAILRNTRKLCSAGVMMLDQQ